MQGWRLLTGREQRAHLTPAALRDALDGSVILALVFPACVFETRFNKIERIGGNIMGMKVEAHALGPSESTWRQRH